MSERYTSLYRLDNNLYLSDAPVKICAGALLKDNKTGQNVVQLKILNTSDKNINLLSVCIIEYDAFGEVVNDSFEYKYLDLDIKPSDSFGENIAIILPNSICQKIGVFCKTVSFSDGSEWFSTSVVPWTKKEKEVVDEKNNQFQEQFVKKPSILSKIIAIMQKYFVQLLLSVICIFAGVGIFIRGYFKYEDTFSMYWTNTNTYHGSFRYLTTRVPVQVLFFLIILGSLSIIIFFSWFSIKNHRQYKLIKELCGTISLASLVVGTIVGKNSFDYYSEQYSPTIERWIVSQVEFTNLSFVFYIELVILIAIIVISFLIDKTEYK